MRTHVFAARQGDFQPLGPLTRRTFNLLDHCSLSGEPSSPCREGSPLAQLAHLKPVLMTAFRWSKSPVWLPLCHGAKTLMVLSPVHSGSSVFHSLQRVFLLFFLYYFPLIRNKIYATIFRV